MTIKDMLDALPAEYSTEMRKVKVDETRYSQRNRVFSNLLGIWWLSGGDSTQNSDYYGSIQRIMGNYESDNKL